jgi:hypothetical protein
VQTCDSLAAQHLSSRTRKSVIGTLMMRAIAEAQSSSSEASMTKRPALVVIQSHVQHGGSGPGRRITKVEAARGVEVVFG